MDISMCFGNNCAIKESCKRYAGKSINPMQSYSDFKWEEIDGEYLCERYIEMVDYSSDVKSKKSKNG